MEVCITWEDLVSMHSFYILYIKVSYVTKNNRFSLFQDGTQLHRTEILTKGQVLTGPDLPYPVENHCIVKLSSDTFLLTGGHDL